MWTEEENRKIVDQYIVHLYQEVLMTINKNIPPVSHILMPLHNLLPLYLLLLTILTPSPPLITICNYPS